MTGRGMNARDLLRLRFASDPQISPDGSQVAFVVTTLSEERDEYLSAIWLVDAGGGAPRQFTAGQLRDRAPRWSPDGRQLAFVSEREPGKKGQLHVMRADGGEPRRISDARHGIVGFDWSPDGTRLVFGARVGGPPEPETEAEKRLSQPPRVITTLAYKYNGEGFVHDRRRHLFVVSADGGPARQITDGDWDDMDPVWAPDGRAIAFASARHADRDRDDALDIWIVPAGGGEPRRVTDTAGPAVRPAFSPDGGTIAYLGRLSIKGFGRNVDLLAVPEAGGPARALSAALDRSCGPIEQRPLWSGDGAFITFAVEDRGGLGLYRVSAGGGRLPEPVVAGPRVVTGLSAARSSGRLAFAATDPVTPPEVFVCEADGGAERRLTDLNRQWRAEVSLAIPERFTVSRAGHEVEGWVMRPPGLGSGRAPGLLNVHGGPHAAYGHGFFDEFQVYAGAGHAVVYVNPRGSQGYGEAFTRAVVGDWGGGDVDDVLAGLDEALRRFSFIDPERLGVMGGSYGGFVTSWIVGHTDRFVAACSERAVNSQLSMFGTSDIGYLFSQVELGGVLPWNDPQRYLARSPLTYAPRITTPLLIIHAEDDLRCPIEQAEQLFVALKMLGREAVLVRFPGENHEMSRSGRPRHRLERFRIILDWFGRRLVPAR
jgi:dipeptidyl aminopeptidase/acylaminoacyl peptidase